MAKQKPKPPITCFSPDEEFFAVLSPDGRTVKIWNAKDGSLLAEWISSDAETDSSYSCIAFSHVGKKHRKERACLLAIGTKDGQVLGIDIYANQMKWKSCVCQSGGLASLSFANKGTRLYAVGTDGLMVELNSQNGELLKEFKVSKKPVSSVGFSCEKKILSLFDGKIRVLSCETGKELLKIKCDSSDVQHMAFSDDAKAIITSGLGDKYLNVWSCDMDAKTSTAGPVISIRHPARVIECKTDCNDGDALVILAVSESGVAYLWRLGSISQGDAQPSKVKIKASAAEMSAENRVDAKKSQTSIITARLKNLEADKEVTVLIVHGSIDAPQFHVVNVSIPGEDIVVTGTNAIGTSPEAGAPTRKDFAPGRDPKSSKKRAASDIDSAEGTIYTGNDENVDGVVVEYDLNEPTMGEKLEQLTLLDGGKNTGHDKQEPPTLEQPRADSVNVLLKQALRADDRSLLLDCLYTQNDKVIANSISLLNTSDVLKLLHFLISIVESRGAVLACALPWLKRLLLQHASGIMSQEASVVALNTLYQLIESRVSTFQTSLQLSTTLDFLYATVIDEGEEEEAPVKPAIYEDEDSEEEGSESAMETDHGSLEEEQTSGVVLDGDADDGIDGMSD